VPSLGEPLATFFGAMSDNRLYEVLGVSRGASEGEIRRVTRNIVYTDYIVTCYCVVGIPQVSEEVSS